MHATRFNFVQIQPGMSVPEFIATFGIEEQCEAAQKAARRSDGFRCPQCERTDHYVVGRGARRLLQRQGLRHQATLTACSLIEWNTPSFASCRNSAG
ncbi:hypothetical protein [Roseateles saccharophilus]|uniref:hypothetical protein n=1 Tax=Roseateles saccharophilus TaxID=304 RepID=UPI0039F111B9